MEEQAQDKSFLASEEQADLEDIRYYWSKVKHFARCLEDRGYDVSIGGLLRAVSTDVEIKKA